MDPKRAVAHRVVEFLVPGSLMRFVADQGHNHTVQVEEEHQEVEAQFDERFLRLLATYAKPASWRGKNTPSCAHSACGRSRSRREGAGSHKSCIRQLYPAYPQG